MDPELYAFAVEILRYDPRWLALGLAPPSLLEAQRAAWERGEDANTEHYRAAALKRFFDEREEIGDALLDEYLDACEYFDVSDATDSDPGPGG